MEDKATKQEIMALRSRIRKVLTGFLAARTEIQLMFYPFNEALWHDSNEAEHLLSKIEGMIENWAEERLPGAPDGN